MPSGLTRQSKRRAFQLGFFLLFLLAPALDLLRFDVAETQLYVLGIQWHLGIDALMQGRATPAQAALNLIVKALLPAIVLIAVGLTIAWRYGRLYCGWLCPHFSVVELLNGFLRKAGGRFSLWDKHPLPPTYPNGDEVQRSRWWWPAFALGAVTFAALWAVTLLSYLLPPAQVWHNLLHATLTPNQARFMVAATIVFTAEFLFARHLFCRFGCAVGLFQSLVWMANDRGMVVSFDRQRARDCRTCHVPHGSACDNACPMRLNPRDIKRMMFSCVQCGQCMEACEQSQQVHQREPLLTWKVDAQAVAETIRQRRSAMAQAAPPVTQITSADRAS
ncbi:MAG: 4Fe-4S binding protein [Burkholderiales bacterium]|nr:4Fe-4S binding protein [Burkholderiales bacterium]